MWTEWLQAHGYWLLALACLLEGETVLVLAAYAAHRGWLDPLAVFSIAASAGFAGDQAFFWLGRWRGARLLVRWPSLGRASERVSAWIERWHEALIIGLRFAYGLRIAGPVLMGMSPLSGWRFATFNAVGALLWAALVGGVGWFAGAAAQAWLGELRHLEGWLFGALAILLGAWTAVQAIRHRRRDTRRLTGSD